MRRNECPLDRRSNFLVAAQDGQLVHQARADGMIYNVKARGVEDDSLDQVLSTNVTQHVQGIKLASN